MAVKAMTELDDRSVAEDGADETIEEKQTQETHSRRGDGWILFAVAGLIIALDQLTKYVIEQTLPLYESWQPFPAIANLFQITHATNTGAAFGLFPSGSTLFAILAVVVAVGIIYYNYTLGRGHRLLRVALGLQLGGAIGNLADRLRQGYVTDFLDFGPWPVFNIADTAIVAGVILLAWLMLMEERAEMKQRKVEETTTTAEDRSKSAQQQVDESSAG